MCPFSVVSAVAFVANAHFATVIECPLCISNDGTYLLIYAKMILWWKQLSNSLRDGYKTIKTTACIKLFYAHVNAFFLALHLSRHKYFMFHELLNKWQWIQDVLVCVAAPVRICCCCCHSICFISFHKSKTNEKCALIHGSRCSLGLNTKRAKLNVSIN